MENCRNYLKSLGRMALVMPTDVLNGKCNTDEKATISISNGAMKIMYQLPFGIIVW